MVSVNKRHNLFGSTCFTVFAMLPLSEGSGQGRNEAVRVIAVREATGAVCALKCALAERAPFATVTALAPMV